MIPIKTHLEVIDEMPGEEIEFTIGDPGIVMQHLAGLYSDPVTAFIREYATNAFDAHTEAGIKRPIEVTVPSALSNLYKVRDYGLGMSPKVLRMVYTSFSTSTKTNSNDYNGMLGFGSKSAIAYTSAFTVETIHEGIKTTASISKKTSGAGLVMKIIDESPTNEPSGTLITIPTHEYREVVQKAKDFFKFWPAGTVLVNGIYPEQYVGDEVVDGIYYSKENSYNTSYVVMGNVAYRINNPRALFTRVGMNNMNFVAYIPNGSVEFTPAREDLMYTPATEAYLIGIVEKFQSHILKAAQAQVSAAKTAPEAWKTWHEWRRTFNDGSLVSDFTYNGMNFTLTSPMDGYQYRPETQGGTKRIEKWAIDRADETVFITDYPHLGAPTSYHKNRVRVWAEQVGINHSYFVFLKATSTDSPWIDKSRTIKWETLLAQVPRKVVVRNNTGTNPNTGRIAGSWDYFDRKTVYKEKELPTTGDLFYISLQDSKNVSGPTVLSAIDSDATVIIVPGNRVKKFLRENPSIQEFTAFAKTKVVKDESTLYTEEVALAKRLDRWNTQWFAFLGARDDVKDPIFKKMNDIFLRRNEILKPINDNSNLAHWLNLYGYVTASKPLDDVEIDIDDTYPLLPSSPSRHNLALVEHYVAYINAVYKK